MVVELTAEQAYKATAGRFDYYRDDIQKESSRANDLADIIRKMPSY